MIFHWDSIPYDECFKFLLKLLTVLLRKNRSKTFDYGLLSPTFILLFIKGHFGIFNLYKFMLFKPRSYGSPFSNRLQWSLEIVRALQRNSATLVHRIFSSRKLHNHARYLNNFFKLLCASVLRSDSLSKYPQISLVRCSASGLSGLVTKPCRDRSDYMDEMLMRPCHHV